MIWVFLNFIFVLHRMLSLNRDSSWVSPVSFDISVLGLKLTSLPSWGSVCPSSLCPDSDFFYVCLFLPIPELCLSLVLFVSLLGPYVALPPSQTLVLFHMTLDQSVSWITRLSILVHMSPYHRPRLYFYFIWHWICLSVD